MAKFSGEEGVDDPDAFCAAWAEFCGEESAMAPEEREEHAPDMDALMDQMMEMQSAMDSAYDSMATMMSMMSGEEESEEEESEEEEESAAPVPEKKNAAPDPLLSRLDAMEKRFFDLFGDVVKKNDMERLEADLGQLREDLDRLRARVALARPNTHKETAGENIKRLVRENLKNANLFSNL